MVGNWYQKGIGIGNVEDKNANNNIYFLRRTLDKIF